MSNDLTGVIDITQLAELFFGFILAFTTGAANSPVGAFITGLLKKFLPNTDPRKLALVSALGLTLVVYGATAIGRLAQLTSLFEWVLAIAPATLAFVTTVFGQTWVHNRAFDAGVPIAGWKKAKPMEIRPHWE